MPRHRIAVGLNGSAGARDALTWALRLAARRSAAVLVVTAWPDAARAVSRRRNALRPDRLALVRMQQGQIAAATAAMRHHPPILRELVLSDPVTALCHAAARADLVVVGASRPGRPNRASTGARLEARLAAGRTRGRRVPPVVAVVNAGTVLRPPRTPGPVRRWPPSTPISSSRSSGVGRPWWRAWPRRRAGRYRSAPVRH